MSKHDPPTPHIVDRVDVSVDYAQLGDLRRALAAAESLPDTATVTLFGVQKSATYVDGYSLTYHARIRLEQARSGDDRT